jgi:hypothetical protein
MVVVNDDQRRIWYFNAGWPGSTHDDQVFQNSRIVLDLDDHFQEMEYIIGDGVYGPQTFMVSVYKKPAVGSHLHPDNDVFNKKLVKPHVPSKHTLGILKGRFPFLWSIFGCDLPARSHSNYSLVRPALHCTSQFSNWKQERKS